MPGQRRYGMDHEFYRWSPMIRRGTLRWPDNARVALCVLVTLEHLEWNPPAGTYQSPTVAGGRGSRAFPNYLRFSHREYGHRVGIFRVLETLARHDVKATHGAGCTHSATLAALLARGESLEDAARGAARVASEAVRNGLTEIGAGEGPVNVRA